MLRLCERGPYATLVTAVIDEPTPTSTATAYSRLLSLAVHEFRTPASVVGGYLRMLLRDDERPLTERQRHMVEEAEKSCARIVALVAELSEISKLDSGTATAKHEPFDLFGVLEEVAESVHEARDRDVTLRVRGPSAGAPMSADLPRLRTAFAALFRAVLREQPSSSTVVVDRRRTTLDGRDAALIVVARDEEVEAASGARPAAFDEKRGGLGLLLPIAQRVIGRHGGRIWSPAPAGNSDAGPARGAVLVSMPL